MKFKLIKASKKSEKNNYPLLAKDKDSSMIVLFTDRTTGMVLNSNPDILYPIGMYAEDWDEVLDTIHWEVLPKGTVVKLTQD